LIALPDISKATDPWTLLRLSNGLSFELPRNWVVLSGSQRITLDAAAVAMAPIDITTSLPFAANLYDESGRTIAIMNVRIYPEMDISQSEVSSLSVAEVAEFDSILKQEMIPGMAANGLTVTEWLGTKLLRVGEFATLVTEYKRVAVRGDGIFVVRLFRVFDESRSFTLTVSYLQSGEVFLRPITDYISRSVERR